MASHFVETILGNLKKRLDHNSALMVQQCNGYLENSKCLFNPAASQKEIDELSRVYKVNLPEDYRYFLQLHNGARLFLDQHGTHVLLMDIDEILDLHYMELPDGWIPIASILDDLVFLDCIRSVIYCHMDGLPFIDSACLHCDYATWLDRIITTQGERFWEWR